MSQSRETRFGALSRVADRLNSNLWSYSKVLSNWARFFHRANLDTLSRVAATRHFRVTALKNACRWRAVDLKQRSNVSFGMGPVVLSDKQL